MNHPKIKTTHNPLQPTFPVTATDQFNQQRQVNVSGESPLTILLNGIELVTLMTLGTYPEELALGYLYNQRILENSSDIRAVEVNWERECVDVNTYSSIDIKELEKKLSQRIVTSGCGQGTVFSCTLDKLYDKPLASLEVKQSTIYALLKTISEYNQIYKSAGAVHGCALCKDDQVLMFVEDVGRHNAADAIAGMMWLQEISGGDKIFYTTGRLTSEIVIKSAHMGISFLLSRSGITHMGLELACDLNMTMIARAKGAAFLVYNNPANIIYDAIPKKPRKIS